MSNTAARIGDIIEFLGISGPAGFAIGLHLTYTTPRYLLHTYPGPWQEIYVREGFAIRDPTVHWGLANVGWIAWSDLRKDDPDHILDLAADHGMRYGVSVAISEHGSRTIASFARPDRAYTAPEAEIVRDRVTELHGLTVSIHALPASLHDLLRRLSVILTRC